MDEYIQVSKEKYGYNAEQALGMLFWHKHDLDKAIQVICTDLLVELQSPYVKRKLKFCVVFFVYAGFGQFYAFSWWVDGRGQGAVWTGKKSIIYSVKLVLYRETAIRIYAKIYSTKYYQINSSEQNPIAYNYF